MQSAVQKNNQSMAATTPSGNSTSKQAAYSASLFGILICSLVTLCVVSQSEPVSQSITMEINHFPATKRGEEQGLAVVRTFCPADVFSLEDSFHPWDNMVPCKHNSVLKADLVLVYSQSLPNVDGYDTDDFDEDYDMKVRLIFDRIEERFHETNGWNGCFDKLRILDTKIAYEDDLYDPKQRETSYMWVNGPNRQFERTVRKLQSLGYESMYLMEMDSVPVTSYWLDEIVSEMKQQTSFAILGSKYKGDKWDSFYSELPPALVNHINGNALYNLTHPLLQSLVRELEAEAGTVGNAIPYDYRISQMMEEGKTGSVPEFPKFNAPNPLLSKTALFASWVEEYPDVIRETKLLGNYAGTNMLPSHVGSNEVVIHGANMYEPWDESEMGRITLVVSDWTDSNAQNLLSLLKGTSHPFSRIVIMLPDNASLTLPETDVPVDIHYRGSAPDTMDICSAPVNTAWFMITNSYHRVRPNVQLMAHSENGTLKPAVSFATPTMDNCFQYSSCTRDFSVAKQIYSQADNIFRNDDMVFRTFDRNDVCDLWKGAYDFGDNVPPSATSYMAHLEKQGRAENLYRFSNRFIYGSRDIFVRLPVDSLSPTLKAQALSSASNNRRLDVEDQAALNETNICTIYVFENDCLDAGCYWNADFASCRSNRSSPTPLVTESTDSQGGFRNHPQWAKALIGVGIAAGCVFVVGTLGAATYRRLVDSDDSGSIMARDVDDISEEELNEIVSVGEILRDLEGGAADLLPPIAEEEEEEDIQALNPNYSFQHNGEAAEFTWSLRSMLTTEEILQDLDSSNSFQQNGEAVEFTRSSRSVVEL